MAKTKQVAASTEEIRNQEVPEYDPETQELKQVKIFDNGQFRGHGYVVEEKKEKAPVEIISEKIMELKLNIAKGMATDQDRDDLRLLLS